MNSLRTRLAGLCLLFMVIGLGFGEPTTFRVATYNVENYLDQPVQGRRVKSAQAKAQVRESIRALKPDVLALQEMGSTTALQELRASLKSEGLDFPHWEHVTGFDTNVHVAILSKLPFSARRPHTNDNFLLNGRRFRVSRGFAEVEVEVNGKYVFTLINAHLKSKRPVAVADEAELRLEEAKLLRAKIEARLRAQPEANLIVLGDLNDTKDSLPIRTLIGTRNLKLVDTRLGEQGAPEGSLPEESRQVTWTYFFAKEDTYSRLDYILLSPGMAREWVTNESFILTLPAWGMGSDHRPLVATFKGQNE
jgi:endonuclease/exonuclease/phosphatase family metal-dependent hydrolase